MGDGAHSAANRQGGKSLREFRSYASHFNFSKFSAPSPNVGISQEDDLVIVAFSDGGLKFPLKPPLSQIIASADNTDVQVPEVIPDSVRAAVQKSATVAAE